MSSVAGFDRKVRSILLPVILGVLAGCSEKEVLGSYPVQPEPLPQLPQGAVLLTCRVDVPTSEMSCAEPALPALPGASADRVIGEQDVYVKLSSSGTSYDAGTETFATSVTVQNLTRHILGTPDGLDVTDVQVFFHTGPVATGGSGTVSVANPSGMGTFMGSEQPYFSYDGVLRPLEISGTREWLFSVPPSVTSFTFGVYVSAAMVEENAALLGSVWNGTVSSEWTAPGNWDGAAVPDASSAVTVLPTALQEGENMPALTDDVDVEHLRVGTGSTLDLGSFRATVTGNVDAPGQITNGVVAMGAGLLGGTVPGVVISGAVRLQRPTVATGAVSVRDGALTVRNQPLSIRVP